MTEQQRTEPSRLLEVWGDTVDSRHLVWSILLGVGLGAPAYLLAEWGFAQSDVAPGLQRSYALLAGIAACIVAAVVAARLFAPKRTVVVGSATVGSRDEAMDAIEAEIGPLGDPDELPARLLAEVRALGLYDDLAAQHRRRSEAAARGEVA
ncbi:MULTISPECIES: hypothetical protein [unclassified Agrococcus]|uniref:hypothetical protein n=1 Tax=unclassified Agrococcus TaxID=2615065 RepID=UPI003618EF8C